MKKRWCHWITDRASTPPSSWQGTWLRFWWGPVVDTSPPSGRRRQKSQPRQPPAHTGVAWRERRRLCGRGEAQLLYELYSWLWKGLKSSFRLTWTLSLSLSSGLAPASVRRKRPEMASPSASLRSGKPFAVVCWSPAPADGHHKVHTHFPNQIQAYLHWKCLPLRTLVKQLKLGKNTTTYYQ